MPGSFVPLTFKRTFGYVFAHDLLFGIKTSQVSVGKIVSLLDRAGLRSVYSEDVVFPADPVYLSSG